MVEKFIRLLEEIKISNNYLQKLKTTKSKITIENKLCCYVLWRCYVFLWCAWCAFTILLNKQMNFVIFMANQRSSNNWSKYLNNGSKVRRLRWFPSDMKLMLWILNWSCLKNSTLRRLSFEQITPYSAPLSVFHVTLKLEDCKHISFISRILGYKFMV